MDLAVLSVHPAPEFGHGGGNPPRRGFAPSVAVLQSKRTQRSRQAAPRRAAADFRELERPSADIAYQSFGSWPAVDYAHPRETRLLLAGRHVQFQAGRPLDFTAEFRTVRRLANRGGRDSDQIGGHPFSHERETLQSRERSPSAFGIQPPGLGHPGAEAAQNSLVVEIRGGSHGTVENDQPYGIRPDVDNSDPA